MNAGSRLGRRLTLLIVLSSGAFTVLATAIQLGLDYRRGTNVVEQRLLEVEESHVPALTESVWAADDHQVQAQLQGLLDMPDIERVELDLTDRTDPVEHRVGEVTSRQTRSHAVQLTRTHRGQDVVLGELRVVAGLDRVVHELRARVLVILATQTAKTFLISALILLLVNRLVTRHVSRIARHAASMVPGDENALVLDRDPRDDELKVLVDAFDQLNQRVAQALAELDHERANLEDQVKARTLQLQRSEARIRALMSHFPGTVWITDADGRLLSATGARSQEVLGQAEPGQPIRSILGAEAAQAHAKAASTGLGQFDLVAAERTYEVRVERLDEGSVGNTLIGVALDVTTRRQAEAQRIQDRTDRSQRLESLGLLAGGIAHDFNNLLVGLLGNASLASSALEAGHPAAESLRQIEVTARRASELTRQMLAYSGRGQFVVEPLDLGQLVRELSTLLRASIAKGARLSVSCEDAPLTVNADAAQIRQLVMNFITNASDALNGRDGNIRVRVARQSVDHAFARTLEFNSDLPPGEYICLTVADSGQGMTPQVRQRIFEPFFTTKETGHGLGLAASLGIVRGHEGALAVYSEPERGTTFQVLIPATSRAPVQEAATDTGPLDGQGRRVLLADDDEHVREFLRRALRYMDFDVHEAEDGLQAVHQLRHLEQVDLAILDLTMPTMGGAEASVKLRQIQRDLPILLTSGYSRDEVGGSLQPGQYSGFLQKPYTLKELTEAIRAALSC